MRPFVFAAALLLTGCDSLSGGPSSPRPIAPVQDEYVLVDVSFSLVWERVDGVEQYRVEVSRSEDFAVILHVFDTPATVVTVSATDDGSYYWRVRGDDESSWSDVQSFLVVSSAALEIVLSFNDNSANWTTGIERVVSTTLDDASRGQNPIESTLGPTGVAVATDISRTRVISLFPIASNLGAFSAMDFEFDGVSLGTVTLSSSREVTMALNQGFDVALLPTTAVEWEFTPASFAPNASYEVRLVVSMDLLFYSP